MESISLEDEVGGVARGIDTLRVQLVNGRVARAQARRVERRSRPLGIAFGQVLDLAPLSDTSFPPLQHQTPG